jgi:hypothetical protein
MLHVKRAGEVLSMSKYWPDPMNMHTENMFRIKTCGKHEGLCSFTCTKYAIFKDDRHANSKIVYTNFNVFYTQIHIVLHIV